MDFVERRKPLMYVPIPIADDLHNIFNISDDDVQH